MGAPRLSRRRTATARTTAARAAAARSRARTPGAAGRAPAGGRRDARSRAAKGAAVAGRPQPKKGSHVSLTGRAAILAVTLAAVALAVALPFKVFVAQRQEINRLAAQERSQQAHVDALRAQQARWNDPAFVRAQARSRLHFVAPGETAYVVLGPTRATTPPKDTPAVVARNRPWYSQLWQSVEAAGAPAKPARPAVHR